MVGVPVPIKGHHRLADTDPMGGKTENGPKYNDKDTSKAAAKAVKKTWKETVFEELKSAPRGLAPFELEQRTGYRFCGQRCSDLIDAKRARYLNETRINPDYDSAQHVVTVFDDNGKLLVGKTAKRKSAPRRRRRSRPLDQTG